MRSRALDVDRKPSSGFRHTALYQLVLARLLEFIRQPEAIFWVYVFPLIMMVALGTAFRSRPVEALKLDIVEGPNADAVAKSLGESDQMVVEIIEESVARQRLRTGKTDVVIVCGSDSEIRYDYLFDPTRPGSLLARNAADDALQRAAGRKDVVEARNREVSEPGGRYIDFLVPGLLGMGLLGGGLWGVGFAIVDLRIRKLLKRYVATPMKRSHFLAALMISRLVFTIPEVVLLLVFARFVFGVVNHGSFLTVGLFIIVGAFQFAGIGLLVACRAQTLETVSGLMNLVMLPMWIASGIFYSIERFPEAIQPVLRFLPLTPLIDAMRAIMQEGATLASLGFELVFCFLWGLITFALALRWFRWS